MPEVQRILDALPGYKRYGKSYRARCPSHQGKSATSLKVDEGRNGKPLIYCFGGCSYEQIMAALRLPTSQARYARPAYHATKSRPRSTLDEINLSQAVAMILGMMHGQYPAVEMHELGRYAEEGAQFLEVFKCNGQAGVHALWLEKQPELQHDHPSLLAEVLKAQQAPMSLAGVVSTFQRWLHLPNPGALYVVLGTYAANRMDGDPLWLMLIGGSGWGKTELLQSIRQLPDVHVASTLTEASLLSGSSRRDKGKDSTGGLLRAIGRFGYLICKDFTSVLSMNRESSTAMLAALREIYDGSWTRHVGVDGGRTLPWEGKMAMLVGCTGAIDRYHAVVGALGERFVSYRLRDLDPQAQARRALGICGQEPQMRKDLSAAVTELFEGLKPLPDRHIPLGTDEESSLVALATLATRCRNPVERNSYTREIELILDYEAPARLALSLRRLYGGMQTVGVPADEARPLIMKVALDCMPALRRAVFTALIRDEGKWETGDLAAKLGYPTQTARRALEDLAAHQVVIRHKTGRADQWNISDFAYELYGQANEVFADEIREDTPL